MRRNSVDPAQDLAKRCLCWGCTNFTWVSQNRQPGSKAHRRQQWRGCATFCGLTFDVSRPPRLAKPAGNSLLERRIRPLFHMTLPGSWSHSVPGCGPAKNESWRSSVPPVFRIVCGVLDGMITTLPTPYGSASPPLKEHSALPARQTMTSSTACLCRGIVAPAMTTFSCAEHELAPSA